MNNRTRFYRITILVAAIICMLSLTACRPTLPLNPRYAYSDFELNLGETIPTDIEEYVDFTQLSKEDQQFVRNNSCVVYDGRVMNGEEQAEIGDHKVTIYYCEEVYRTYTIKITDKEPPVFESVKNMYSFKDLALNSDIANSMFEVSDNSGKFKLSIDDSSINYDKVGEYTVRAKAKDPSGNVSTAEAKYVIQEPKYGAKGTYVYVSIPKQHLTYFVDGKIALETDVVTGNVFAGHATPSGTFVLNGGKRRNLILKGRESNGDEYESFVNYWMPFIGASHGLHDATWRASFGGEIYKGYGSHGCVNMPFDKAAELYEMIEVGTPVLIY